MIRQRKIELLAPAKNLECGIAAVDHGADAIYIGAPRFGARAAAGNSLEDIAELVRYAHVYNVRIYVTVNTILKDEELKDTEKMIWDLYRAGVDALIVQDMGLLELNLPPIPLHASTQMDNRTPQKVRFLAEAGFRQVVLARELSLVEIGNIHHACPDVPLEVFVHGALCVSYSGQCYVSQACFGRSANRGECAQFCRLAFDMVDADGKSIVRNKHLLSLKDLNQSEELEQLLDAGASSLKIDATEKNNFLVLKVWAPNMEVQNEYKVNIRMHTMVPDSLSWGKDPIANNPVSNTAEKQKVVTLGDKILLFAQNNEIYSTAIPAGSPTDRLNYGQKWDKETTGKLPVGADITSIIRFVDKLYLLAENKEVYNSNDGLTWTKDEVLNSDGVSVTNLITSFSDSDGSNHKKINGIAGIVEINGEKYFSFAEKDATWEKDIDKLTAVPAEFPINNLSADVYATESGTLNAIVVGNTKDGLDNDTATVVWASEDGKSWIPMEIPSNNNCPKLVDPSIIHYNDAFYICGKETKDDAKGFQKFYTSPTLLVWKGVDRMFMLPGILPPVKLEGGITQHPSLHESSFKGKEANYTMVVDRNHYIWMVGGQGIDKIWRGRVNKLGFLIQ